jgi:hypothetical protein
MAGEVLALRFDISADDAGDAGVVPVGMRAGRGSEDGPACPRQAEPLAGRAFAVAGEGCGHAGRRG